MSILYKTQVAEENVRGVVVKESAILPQWHEAMRTNLILILKCINRIIHEAHVEVYTKL